MDVTCLPCLAHIPLFCTHCLQVYVDFNLELQILCIGLLCHLPHLMPSLCLHAHHSLPSQASVFFPVPQPSLPSLPVTFWVCLCHLQGATIAWRWGEEWVGGLLLLWKKGGIMEVPHPCRTCHTWVGGSL